MTVRELLEGLTGVPLDAKVEMEVWDEEVACVEGGTSITDIGSVSYNAETNTVTLTEAS